MKDASWRMQVGGCKLKDASLKMQVGVHKKDASCIFGSYYGLASLASRGYITRIKAYAFQVSRMQVEKKVLGDASSG